MYAVGNVHDLFATAGSKLLVSRPGKAADGHQSIGGFEGFGMAVIVATLVSMARGMAVMEIVEISNLGIKGISLYKARSHERFLWRF